MATEPTNLRLDPEAKERAYAIFNQIGLKPAQAFNLFLHQVALRGGLPFDVKVPNADTLAAIEETEKGLGTRYKNADEMFNDLGMGTK